MRAQWAASRWLAPPFVVSCGPTRARHHQWAACPARIVAVPAPPAPGAPPSPAAASWRSPGTCKHPYMIHDTCMHHTCIRHTCIHHTCIHHTSIHHTSTASTSVPLVQSLWNSQARPCYVPSLPSFTLLLALLQDISLTSPKCRHMQTQDVISLPLLQSDVSETH
jgi:hypothetical protein